MDQRLKAFLVFGTISVIIYVIILMTSSENNYLNPSGNRNPANQKLMVVDQDSGEISFIQKSLQGVNAQIATDDSVISDAIAQLRADMMEHSEYANRRIDSLGEGMGTRLDKLETFMNQFLNNNEHNGAQMRSALFNKIDNGQRIGIKVINPMGRNFKSGETDASANARDHWLNDDGCDSK